MIQTDPRYLLVILDDLMQELARWSSRASEEQTRASYVARQAREEVDQAGRRGAVVRNQTEADRRTVKDTAASVSRCTSKCEHGLKAAKQAEEETQKLRQTVESTMAHWTEQLARAKDRHEQMRNRFQEAERAEHKAEAALQQAKVELSNAKIALKQCQAQAILGAKDAFGSRLDCSAARARVATAQKSLAASEIGLARARSEHAIAKRELELAEERVQACQRAVGHSNQAAVWAVLACGDVSIAVTVAEQAAESARRVRRDITTAERHASRQEKATAAMIAAARDATHEIEEAKILGQQAVRSEASAQRHLSHAASEIAFRMDQLRAFNHPLT